MDPIDDATPTPEPAVPDPVTLSRDHAARGEARPALLAMWAADVAALQQLLWENGIGDAPDPAEHLAAVGDAVAGSVAAVADELGEVTVRRLAERCREAMVATFDASVHDVLAERLAPLDHLDALPAPAAAASADQAAARLDGRTPQQLVADLRVTASDCRAVAEVMRAEGDVAGEEQQLRQADLATFEAYLVAAAVGAGDATLASVDLRWELAERALRPAAGDRHDRHDRLVGVVGWSEAPVLRACFGPGVQR